MEEKLKILFLADGIHPFTIGGMQKHSSELVYGLLEAGSSVTLIFSVDHDQNLPSDVEVHEKIGLKPEMINNLKLKSLNFPSPGKFPGHYIKESYRFSEMIYSFIKVELKKFDFVFAQGFTAWKLLEEKSKGEIIPPIGVHFHGLNMFQKTFGWKAGMIARVFRNPVEKNLKMTDYIFSYGGKFKEIYKTLGVEKKCIFQPIGIDADEIRKEIKPAGKIIRFVFIGRNDKVKGLNVYHDAIRKIPDGKFEFIFVGDVPEKFHIARTDCSYRGKVGDKEKNEILESSDVLVCPSYSEGMPYVILEAMANGLIVLSTDVGAISEMMDDSNGIMIPPSDPFKLKEAILRIGNMEKVTLNSMKNKSLEKAWKLERTAVIHQLIGEIKKRKSSK